MRRFTLITACAVAMLGVGMSSSVKAVTFLDYGIFANQLTDLGTNINVHGGLVGSNDRVEIGGGSDELILSGGGVLNGGTNLDIDGDVIFNSHVNVGGGSDILGNIESGGNIALGTNVTVRKNGGAGGNVIAAGSIGIGGGSHIEGNVVAGSTASGGSNAIEFGTNVTVDGSVGANGSIDVGGGSDIAGTVTHPFATSTYTKGVNVTDGGEVNGTVTPTPSVYMAVTDLPVASIVTPDAGGSTGGGGNTFSLLPGQYNEFDWGTNNVLNLTSGVYEFESFDLGGGGAINIDLSVGSGQFALLANDFIRFGTNVDIVVTGGSAADIFWEALNEFEVGGGSTFVGTAYVADGIIDFGTNIDITGALYAGGSQTNPSNGKATTGIITLGGGSTLNFLPASRLTPDPFIIGPPALGGLPCAVSEPASAVLMFVGALTLLRRRKQAV